MYAKITEEQQKRALESLKRATQSLKEKRLIREALQDIHDDDSEYQKERKEIDERYHAELLKLEKKYLQKHNVNT